MRVHQGEFPHIYLYTSTNGLAFTEDQARRLVHSGIDEVTFSIDGATQETYVKYRQRGKFDVAIANLRAMADEKRRAGRDLPFLNWRYILFNWNDSDEEMDRARDGGSKSASIGCAGKSPTIPKTCYSRRLAAGLAAITNGIRHEIWDDNNLGNAIPGATPRAPRSIAGRRGRPGGCRLVRRSGLLLQCGPKSTTCPPGRSPPRPRTAGGWCGSARNSAPPTARSSIATLPGPASARSGADQAAEIAINFRLCRSPAAAR